MANPDPISQYDDIIDAASKEWNIDPNLIRATMRQESVGKPNATSSAGAVGLMQIMPKTAQDLGVADRTDPVQSIYGGAKYLSQMLDQFGHPALALAAYNAGPERVQEHLATGRSLPAETQAYVPAVASHYKAYASAPVTPLAPASAPVANDDFNRKWGLTEPAPSTVPPAPATQAPADFEKRWGLSEPPAAPATTPAVAAAQPAASPDYTGWDVAVAPKAAVPNPLSSAYTSISNALAPAPNTTYGNVIPFAKDNATGALRPALPQMWRDLGQGAVDLAFGPAMGTVTPKATMALVNAVPGLMPSPARGTGAAIAAYADRPAPVAPPAAIAAPQNPLSFTPGAPEFVPPGTQAPTMGRIRELIDADNAVAKNRPDFIPPDATQPPNPLDAVRTPQAPTTAATNPLATPTPSPRSILPTASQQALELSKIPEKLPPAPLIPPTTETSAASRAGQLIEHFAGGKPKLMENPDIVPGYAPKLSGLTNDPGIATLERGIQAVAPGPIGARDQANQSAIRTFAEQLQGTPEDVLTAQAAREAATAPLREAAFANAKPVDPTPIVSQIDRILGSPEGKRAAVKSTLAKVKDSLFNADGEVETDPNMLYGVRKNLNDLLDPVAQKDNPQLQQAARQLLDVKGNLDDVIEAGAPGFKQYVQQFSELSKPIDAQRYLQSLNLTNAADNVRLQSVDAAIKSIERQQQMPGVQKASAVSEDQLNALKTLRNTLRMEQFSSTAGKTLGSNTFQNLATNSMAGRITGNPLVNVGMAVTGSAAGGPLGAAIAAGANMAAHSMLGRSEDLVKTALIKRLLNYPEVPSAGAVVPGAPWNMPPGASPLAATP